MKSKTTHYIVSKGKNYRVEIALMQQEYGEKFFFVKTKRLIDFKTRNITMVQNVFSVETFSVLAHASNFFISHPEIMNKVLLKDLSKMKPARTFTNLKIK